MISHLGGGNQAALFAETFVTREQRDTAASCQWKTHWGIHVTVVVQAMKEFREIKRLVLNSSEGNPELSDWFSLCNKCKENVQ